MNRLKEITLLIGRAATGKTERIYEEIRALKEKGSRAILLVPEQFTFETEQRLLGKLGGLFGIEVLSFGRLAERINASSGRSRIPLNEHGLAMLVKKCLLELRQELDTFGPAADRAGLAKDLAALYTKLDGASVRPEDLRNAADTLSEREEGLLKRKLSDLALLFGRVRGDLEDRFLTADDALHTAAKTLRSSAKELPTTPYAGLPVFIDGFSGVSAAALEMTRTLMLCASELTISLTLDPDTKETSDFFAPDRDIEAAIKEYAKEQGIKVKTVRFDGIPSGRSDALGYLEKTIFRFSQDEYEGFAKGILLGSAPSRQREADIACERILQTVRATGCRYSDFAVLVPDLETYELPLRRALDARGIPSFLDERPPLLAHPMSRFLLSAVRCAVRGDPVPDLMTFVKSGFLPIGRGDADLFENYILRFTPTPYHARIDSRFGKDCPEREAAERVRVRARELLVPLKEGFRLPTAREKAESLYALLGRAGVRAALEAEAEQARTEGRSAEMQVSAQVWNGIVDVLDQMITVLGDTPVDPETFLALLQEGVSGMSAGVIPETDDGVLVGDIHKTRLRPVKHMFLLGASEGSLPAPVSDDALLDDRETECLRGAGLKGLHGTERDAALEQRRIYLAVTKAIETLTVTYPKNADGDETVASDLFRSLAELFPDRGSDEAPLPQSREEALYRFGEGLHALSADMNPDELFPNLDEVLKGDADADRMRISGKNDPIFPSLSKETAKALYADLRKMSASRLEAFNRCPFSYFLNYGIGIKERKEAERKATDLGTLYHAALERFLRCPDGECRDVTALTDGECDDLLDRILSDLFPEIQDGYYLDPERCLGDDLVVRNVLSLTFRAVRDQLRAGSFRPFGIELEFGNNGSLPAIPLNAAGGRTLELEGKVDRIDRAADPETEKIYLRVIDYKTGGKTFSYSQLREGLLLQLPLYLSAVRDKGTASGLYYMPIKVDAVSEGEDAPKKLSDGFRLVGVSLDEEDSLFRNGPEYDRILADVKRSRNGLTLTRGATGEQMDAILNAAKAIASGTADRILRGEIRAFPAEDACKRCPYRPCCGFDPALKGCRKKKISGTLKLEEFLAAAAGGNKHELD